MSEGCAVHFAVLCMILKNNADNRGHNALFFYFHRKVRPMKQKGCAASRAEQKLRFSENLDARVCEAHFCSFIGKYVL